MGLVAELLKPEHLLPVLGSAAVLYVSSSLLFPNILHLHL